LEIRYRAAVAKRDAASHGSKSRREIFHDIPIKSAYVKLLAPLGEERWNTRGRKFDPTN